ncbi:four-carbon acid sugar kinase family protein [Mycolicibacterium canariasense]|uniref:four-carbon acid sugar kinase family protein n=1 Tax=Mycolicibacterium canariasense TaxID=228230 RepID=UPI000A6DA008|nr:four-carbon acid sugar kinase family protein [Mycolicibacterium canariasense]
MTGTIAVLADDLSGAAETAAAFLDRGIPVTLCLAAGAVPATGVTVFDLNTRTMTAQDARRVHRATLTRLAPDVLVVKKIDSLLRGNVRAEVDVLAERGPVVVAAALPALRRSVIGGVLHVDGVPLHRTDAWAAESGAPPRSLAELLGPHVTVRDATSDADLDTIVRSVAPGTQLVGTSALAAALARTLPEQAPALACRAPSAGLLAVIGTAHPHAAEQVRRLVGTGVRHVPLAAGDLLSGAADPADVCRALEAGPAVVTVDGEVRPEHASELSCVIGRLVASALPALGARRPDLILTGGETARAVVDALGLTDLRPIHQVHHGAVVSVASDGRSVATRPGSFGDGDSLVAIADYLASPQHVHPQLKDNS